MVVSAALQPPESYLKWHRFQYPTDGGSRDAVAVPPWVANQLNAAYATLLAMTMVHFWSIVVGLIVYRFLRRHEMRPGLLHPLAPTLWNKRADLIDSMIETYTFTKPHWRNLWMFGLLLLIFITWVGQTAMGVLVPPLIILGNAAPVNPEFIYIPDFGVESNSSKATRFALEVGPALRALSSAQVASDDLRQRVTVSPARSLGRTARGDEILRLDYAYRVTGVDFGLQKYPDLALDVTGSCVTEYGWLRSSSNDASDTLVDRYRVFNSNRFRAANVSLFDGRLPVAFFYPGRISETGTLNGSNQTWAAVISSVGRFSFSPSTDPWYRTEPTMSSSTGADNSVMARRPALSCWQDDVWSYRGSRTTTAALTSAALPGTALSDDFGLVVVDRLGVPMIYKVGQQLQSSALLSATTAIQQIFDAGASSIRADLERLVLAAFVATANVLTDTTLYPTDARKDVPNYARVGDRVRDGISDFVVFTPDMAALSVAVIAAIPSVFVAVWLLAIILFYWTPVAVVNALDSNNMHSQLVKNHEDAIIQHDENMGAVWVISGAPAKEGDDKVPTAEN